MERNRELCTESVDVCLFARWLFKKMFSDEFVKRFLEKTPLKCAW